MAMLRRAWVVIDRGRKLALGAAAAAVLPWPLFCSGAAAEPPSDLCRRAATDDTLRPLPQALVPNARRAFRLDAMPAAQIQRSTVFRCTAGRVLLCNSGANLPCGKANTSRRLPGADSWCAEHPGSDFIPMYITGHDTAYRWRCTDARARIVGAGFKLDRRGFFARYWKPAE
jgi:hypothetical protein